MRLTDQRFERVYQSGFPHDYVCVVTTRRDSFTVLGETDGHRLRGEAPLFGTFNAGNSRNVATSHTFTV